MADLLLWLALPLLTVSWLPGSRRPGAIAAQLMIAGFGLAALRLGAGTLDPGDLRMIADQSSRDAWFVAISAGVLMSGSSDVVAFRDRAWLRLVAGLPLIAALIVVAAGHPVPLAIGLALGLLPCLIGLAPVRGVPGGIRAPGVKEPSEAARVDPGSLVLAGAAVLSALAGPTVVALLLIVALVWRDRLRSADAAAVISLPIREVAGSLLLGAWGWFALTIAGAPLASLPALASAAPISPAAETGLALLAIGWAILLAGPWPLNRMARGSVILPVIGIVLHLAGPPVTPDGIAHWQPLLSVILVISALTATATGRPGGAAAALMLLGVTRYGGLPFAGGLAIAIFPTVRHRLPARVLAPLAGGAVGMIVTGMLQDEVLLSVVLVVGLAALAYRSDAVVARVGGSVHL